MPATVTLPGAQSVDEQNVYYALQRLGRQFSFQVPLHGGRAVRGGQVVDFVIYDSPPRKLALYIDGLYWHRNDPENEIKKAEARSMGYRVETLVAPRDTSSIEVIVAALLRIL